MVFYETFFQHAQAIKNGYKNKDGTIDEERGNAACIKYLFTIFGAGLYGMAIDEDDPELAMWGVTSEIATIVSARDRYKKAIKNGSKGGAPKLELDMQEIKRLYLSGLSQKKIAEQMDTSESTIKRRIRTLKQQGQLGQNHATGSEPSSEPGSEPGSNGSELSSEPVSSQVSSGSVQFKRGQNLYIYKYDYDYDYDDKDVYEDKDKDNFSACSARENNEVKTDEPIELNQLMNQSVEQGSLVQEGQNFPITNEKLDHIGQNSPNQDENLDQEGQNFNNVSEELDQQGQNLPIIPNDTSVNEENIYTILNTYSRDNNLLNQIATARIKGKLSENWLIDEDEEENPKVVNTQNHQVWSFAEEA